jgi:hypothetical protein
MGIDYMILVILSILVVILVFIKVIRDEQAGDSGNDGGISVGDDLPEIDLPPGISLPGGPGNTKKDDEIFA